MSDTANETPSNIAIPAPVAKTNGAGPVTTASKSPLEAIESEGSTKRESIFANLEALKIVPDKDDDDNSTEVLSTVPVHQPGKRPFEHTPTMSNKSRRSSSKIQRARSPTMSPPK